MSESGPDKYGKYVDQLFAPVPLRREPAHPSLRFIPRLPAAQGQKTELEQMIRIEAQSRFLKQKKDALLESSDLEKLWNALQEQASKTPTSNGRISYQDFIEVRNKLSEKLQDYFSPSLFLKLEKDELGRISIITFFQFCMRKTSFCRARINIHTFDSSGAGYLTEQDMDNYISDMLKQFPMLKQLDDTLIQYYVCMATRKFFFFLDPMRIMHIPISKILTSSLLAELLDMREENISEEDLINNWFSPVNFHRVYENYLDLDKDEDGLLSSQELSAYATGSFSNIFINRIFQEFHTFQGKLDFKSYLNFILMLRYKSQPESLRLYFRLLDTQTKGYITSNEVLLFVRDMLVKLVEIGISLEYRAEDVRDEVFDLSRPTDRNKITLQDLVRCRSGDTIVGMITDAQRFYNYDQREFNPALAKESVEQIIPPPQEYDQQQMQQQQQQQYRESDDDLDMYDTSPVSNTEISNLSKKRGQTGQNQISSADNDYSGNFYYGNEGMDDEEGGIMNTTNGSGDGTNIPVDTGAVSADINGSISSNGSNTNANANANISKKAGDVPNTDAKSQNAGHDALLADTLFPGTEKKGAEEEDDDFY